MGKRILMICYYYPPLTDVGCKRSVALSKYWKKAGWEPHVLSVKNPDKTYCSLGNDKPPNDIPVTYACSLFNVYKFLGKVNGLLSRILRLFGFKLNRNYFYDLLCIPDIFIGWIIPAIIRGYKIIRTSEIDTIYVSCSPFSAGIIGWWLKKLTGKFLVIDYRDPFGLDISKYQKTAFQSTWFRKPLDRLITGSILKACDLFTVTTGEIKKLYIEQFPSISEKIRTIYNGFDHQLLEDINEPIKFSKFTIIYTGNFYYEIEFDYFFEGLGLLKKTGHICNENFQFLFYGGIFERIQHSLLRYDVEDLVQIKPRIPYTDVLYEIKRSHFQLLRIAQPMISTKLFEGLALNVPFLATVPTGEVTKIITKYSPSSTIVSEKTPEAIQGCIEEIIVKYRTYNTENNLVDKFLANYSRENQAKKYITLLREANCVN